MWTKSPEHYDQHPMFHIGKISNATEKTQFLMKGINLPCGPSLYLPVGSSTAVCTPCCTVQLYSHSVLQASVSSAASCTGGWSTDRCCITTALHATVLCRAGHAACWGRDPGDQRDQRDQPEHRESAEAAQGGAGQRHLQGQSVLCALNFLVKPFEL